MKCEICGKDILENSQCIDYKYYHNDCIINLTKENQVLKKQLEETKTNYEQEKYIVDKQTRQLTDEYKNTENQTNKVDELKNQQKEFIEYLRNLSNWYSADGVKQGMVNEILSKFKEIIGVSNENSKD